LAKRARCAHPTERKHKDERQQEQQQPFREEMKRKTIEPNQQQTGRPTNEQPVGQGLKRAEQLSRKSCR
jgi:hypothetical protein